MLAFSPGRVITDYKSQGRSFDKVILDLRKPKRRSRYGLALYVMLSRARTLDGLYLLCRVNTADLQHTLPEFLQTEFHRLHELSADASRLFWTDARKRAWGALSDRDVEAFHLLNNDRVLPTNYDGLISTPKRSKSCSSSTKVSPQKQLSHKRKLADRSYNLRVQHDEQQKRDVTDLTRNNNIESGNDHASARLNQFIYQTCSRYDVRSVIGHNCVNDEAIRTYCRLMYDDIIAVSPPDAHYDLQPNMIPPLLLHPYAIQALWNPMQRNYRLNIVMLRDYITNAAAHIDVVWENTTCELSYLLFPVNVNNIHWTLLIVHIPSKSFAYYDSYHTSDSRATATLLGNLLAQAFTERNAAPHMIWNKVELNGPVQRNDYDCGIFVLQAIEYVLTHFHSNLKLCFQNRDNSPLRLPYQFQRTQAEYRILIKNRILLAANTTL